nr:hypothetical protein [Cytobacillus oceanisediminis]
MSVTFKIIKPNISEFFQKAIKIITTKTIIKAIVKKLKQGYSKALLVFQNDLHLPINCFWCWKPVHTAHH